LKRKIKEKSPGSFGRGTARGTEKPLLELKTLGKAQGEVLDGLGVFMGGSRGREKLENGGKDV
jgi:hypothetical protein